LHTQTDLASGSADGVANLVAILRACHDRKQVPVKRPGTKA
jgi:hypothetical protein